MNSLEIPCNSMTGQQSSSLFWLRDRSRPKRLSRLGNPLGLIPFCLACSSRITEFRTGSRPTNASTDWTTTGIPRDTWVRRRGSQNSTIGTQISAQLGSFLGSCITPIRLCGCWALSCSPKKAHARAPSHSPFSPKMRLRLDPGMDVWWVRFRFASLWCGARGRLIISPVACRTIAFRTPERLAIDLVRQPAEVLR